MTVATSQQDSVSQKIRRSDLVGLDRIGELTHRGARVDVISYLVAEELKRLGVEDATSSGRPGTGNGRNVA